MSTAQDSPADGPEESSQSSATHDHFTLSDNGNETSRRLASPPTFLSGGPATDPVRERTGLQGGGAEGRLPKRTVKGLGCGA